MEKFKNQIIFSPIPNLCFVIIWCQITTLCLSNEVFFSERDALVFLDDFGENIDNILFNPMQNLSNSYQNESFVTFFKEKKKNNKERIENMKRSIRDDLKNGTGAATASSVKSLVDTVPYFIDGFAYGNWKEFFRGALSIAGMISGALGPLGGHSKAAVDTATILLDLLPKELPSWIKAKLARDSNGSGNPDSTEINWNTNQNSSQINWNKDIVKSNEVVDNGINWSPVDSDVITAYNTTADIDSIQTYFTQSWENLHDIWKQERPIAEKESDHLYSNSNKGLVSFGRLRDVIKNVCQSGKLTVARKNNGKVKGRAKTCKTLVNHYVTMSIENQYLLTNMAAALNSGSLKELKGTALNFIDLVKTEQRRDKKAFRFLYDPFDFPDYRYSVFEFYENPEEYELPISYMNTLEQVDSHVRRPYILACARYFLQSSCDIFEETEASNALEGSYSSIFVPHGTEIKSIFFDDKIPTDNRQYSGPGIYHEIFTKYLDGGRKENHAASFKFATMQEETSPMVELCFIGKRADCLTFPATDNKKKITEYTTAYVESIWIPEGLSVEIYDATDSHVTTYWGPDKVNHVCHPEKWSILKVEKNVNDTKFVKICSEKRFKGNCHQIPSRKDEKNFEVSKFLKDNNVCIPIVRSMSIQDGVKVTVYPGIFGPIIGPKKLEDVSAFNIKGTDSFHITDTVFIAVS